MTPHFTTPCYVQVDTPKERQYLAHNLAEIGYNVCPCVTMGKTCSYEPDAVFVFTAGYSAHIIEEPDLGENSIDCGTNTELFLALASMRSDTDKGQWLVVDELISIGTQVLGIGTMFNLAEDKFDSSIKAHRATTDEIIEHFNK